MLQFIVISLAANLVFGMSGILFTDLVEEEFKLPPIYMSMLLVTIMAMSILGSIMATRLRGERGDYFCNSHGHHGGLGGIHRLHRQCLLG
ncbi:MAG: hypothetical protein ACP5NY_07505 [Thermocladium sp.]